MTDRPKVKPSAFMDYQLVYHRIRGDEIVPQIEALKKAFRAVHALPDTDEFKREKIEQLTGRRDCLALAIIEQVSELMALPYEVQAFFHDAIRDRAEDHKRLKPPPWWSFDSPKKKTKLRTLQSVFPDIFGKGKMPSSYV
jgi:hypothetical protein